MIIGKKKLLGWEPGDRPKKRESQKEKIDNLKCGGGVGGENLKHLRVGPAN